MIKLIITTIVQLAVCVAVDDAGLNPSEVSHDVKESPGELGLIRVDVDRKQRSLAQVS